MPPRSGSRIGVDQVDRPAGRARRRRGRRRPAARPRRPPGAARELGARSRVAVDAAPEVDGELELALGLGEGVQARRPSGGAQQHGQRPGGLLGPEQVVGELGVGALGAGGGQGRVGFERLGHRAVQPEPLARQQLGVHRLLEQGVPEAVAVGVHDQRLVLDRGPQPGRPLGGRHRRDTFEEPVVDVPADQRADARSTSCASAGEPVDADREDVAQGGRDVPVSLTATSSSTKNGLPSARSTSWSTSSRSSPSPPMAVTRSAGGRVVERLEVEAARRCGSRTSSARTGRSGCARRSSSERYVATSVTALAPGTGRGR